ncbi:MAG TPA: SDR family oxidoreductase [Candidatus Saccharimonadia bacterium]|nr:SDR family oxidoreductase [Candidatus Saccharimonadia bacterium]
MEKTPQRTVLITGASDGIGFALAGVFGVHGYRVIAVGSNKARLRQAQEELQQQGFEVVTLVQDLAVSESAKAVAEFLGRSGVTVDVLVNNAGYATFGAFSKNDYDTETREMQLNMVTLTQLTKLLLPAMIRRGSGRILNISSMAAFYPGPYMAVYYATKAYVLHLSEALAIELKGTGVSVTALCPGPTQTGFAKRAGLSSSRMFSRTLPTARDVAESGYSGLVAGKRVVVPGRKNQVTVFMARFVPRSWILAKLAKLQE